MTQVISPGTFMPEDKTLRLMMLEEGRAVEVSDGDWTYVVTKTNAARDVCESWVVGFDVQTDNPAFAALQPLTLPAAFTRVPRAGLPAPIDARVWIGKPLHYRGIATGTVRSVKML